MKKITNFPQIIRHEIIDLWIFLVRVQVKEKFLELILYFETICFYFFCYIRAEGRPGDYAYVNISQTLSHFRMEEVRTVFCVDLRWIDKNYWQKFTKIVVCFAINYSNAPMIFLMQKDWILNLTSNCYLWSKVFFYLTSWYFVEVLRITFQFSIWLNF